LALLFVPIRVNRLPEELGKALDAPASVILYSIQPSTWPHGSFYHFSVLGHVELHGDQASQAIKEFRNSAVNMMAGVWSDERIDNCVISPRHALRVVSEGHTYDFLLCYECHQLEVFRDGKEVTFIAGTTGEPQVLNGLLTAAKIPLAVDSSGLTGASTPEQKAAVDKQLLEGKPMTGQNVGRDMPQR
jgi:hypothetical protein